MSIRKILIILSLFVIPGFYSGCSDGSLLEISRGMYIYTAEDLKMIAKYPDQNFIVMKDIDASGLVLSQSCNNLTGTIEGKGHVIKNLAIANGIYFIEMVDTEGVIKDLGFENKSGGCLVGNNSGTIENCYTTGSSLICGLVYNNVGKIINSHSECTVTQAAGFKSAGFVVTNSGTIEGCYSTSDLSVDSGGGFVWENTGNIINCYCTGDVTGTKTDSSLGGFVYNNRGYIERCYNTGNVAGNGSSIGGFASLNAGRIYRCYSTSSVSAAPSATSNIGGFVGYMAIYMSLPSIEECYCSGTITVTASSSLIYIGGLVGQVFDNMMGSGMESVTIKNSYTASVINTSSLNSNVYAAGLIGRTGSVTVNIIDCYSAASIASCSANVGGFTGYVYSSSTKFTDCFWNNETIIATGSVKNGTPAGTSTVTGLNTTAMKTSSSFTNWNFSTVWGMDNNLNNGYPYLKN